MKDINEKLDSLLDRDLEEFKKGNKSKRAVIRDIQIMMCIKEHQALDKVVEDLKNESGRRITEKHIENFINQIN